MTMSGRAPLYNVPCATLTILTEPTSVRARSCSMQAFQTREGKLVFRARTDLLDLLALP